MAAECRRTAERMDLVARLSSRRLDLLDLKRARRAEELKKQLLDLAERVDGWDRLTLREVAIEQEETVSEVAETLREVLEVLESMPVVGALGPVPRR